MDFEAALDWVWGLQNLEVTTPAKEPYTLDRMVELLSRLGDPQDRIPAVHVAGSKGKGSTAAMIESVLRYSGRRTGFYISPHLYTARERISAGGEMISAAEFARMAGVVRGAAQGLTGLTTFEALTAMAFVYFQQQKVEVAVVEVGLGGRLDATNLIRRPLAAVITPLSLEHTAILGDTLEAIAFEKAGIIKPGAPVVTAPQAPEALRVLRRVAEERGAPLISVAGAYTWRRTELRLEGQTFEIFQPGPERSHAGDPPAAEGQVFAMHGLQIPFLGLHQVDNAAAAVAALRVVAGQGFDWTEEALRAGLANVRWPARTEIVSREPFVLVDGAHNGASARVLAEVVREIKKCRLVRWNRLWFVVGASSDKRIEDILQPMLPLVDGVIATRSKHPRAFEPELLRQRLSPLLSGRDIPLLVTSGVEEALREAIEQAGPDGGVVVAGSLFTAAEARDLFTQGR